MRDELISILKSAGKETEMYKSSDGSEVLVLPYGGRVLGLFAPGSQENFYWTHPALESAEAAKEFLGSEAWQNTGGDRTWLAPEIDTFLPNYPKLDAYVQQRSLDPGNYKIEKCCGGFKLVSDMTISISRLKTTVDLKISKSFGPAPNPLRYERGLTGLEGVSYAGYTQFATLELADSSKDTKAAVGLWNLVEMPWGGDLIIPTYSRTEPKVIFGEIPDSDLVISDNLILYKMNCDVSAKIGIRAVATCGRVGYIHKTGDQWALIIRNFAVNPSGEYVDVPWDDPDYRGYSTQACNVDIEGIKWNELEYHIPGIGAGTGQTRVDDQAQVWAYRGSLDALKKIAGVLLTPNL